MSVASITVHHSTAAFRARACAVAAERAHEIVRGVRPPQYRLTPSRPMGTGAGREFKPLAVELRSVSPRVSVCQQQNFTTELQQQNFGTSSARHRCSWAACLRQLLWRRESFLLSVVSSRSTQSNGEGAPVVDTSLSVASVVLERADAGIVPAHVVSTAATRRRGPFGHSNSRRATG